MAEAGAEGAVTSKDAGPGGNPEGATEGLLGDGAEGSKTESRDSGGANEGLLGDGAKEDGAKEGGAKTERVGAPESYADFTLPEGVAVAPERMTAFTDLARQHDLSQEAAQSFVDFHLQEMQAAAEAAERGGKEEFSTLVKGWEQSSKRDPEFGGPKLEASLTKAKSVLKALGSPELVQAMALTGLTSHPAMIRFVLKVADAVGEDVLVPGGGPGGKTSTPGDRMFPTLAAMRDKAQGR